MARGGRRRGGGGRGAGGGPTPTGIEKYGQDEVDEFLNLDEDVLSDGGGFQDVLGEEDVLKLNTGPEDEKAKGKKAKKAKKKRMMEEEAEEEEQDGEDEEPEEEKLEKGAMTKGWRKQDFYGGDDLGDISGSDSDEEMVLEEARKLEELRAKRLKGEADPLTALLSHSKPEAPKEAKDDTADAAPAAGPGTSAQFETLFAAEAERGAVKRDLAQLTESTRRGLLKSEAPELVPLLTDFKSKLEGLQELLPLLAPKVHEYMKPTGVAYLKAKAALLLNTLANLSYYIMLRAEGGAVRSHPVITQLVWLRELHEQVAPLDKKLAPALAKARKQWRKLQKLGLGAEGGAEASNGGAIPTAPGSGRPPEEPAKPAKPLSLRERFLQQRVAKEREAAAEAAKVAAAAAVDPDLRRRRGELSTEDLLRLPGKKGKQAGAAGEPADLDEADPLVGGWRPTSTMAEQLLSVRQHLGERVAKAKVVSADHNVEPQPLRARQRMRESQAEVDAAAGKPSPLGEEDAGEEETAPAPSARKARKEAAKEAKRQALLAQQFKPEEVLDGRRATSTKILKNRGLVRQRKQFAGNARVANRKKYEKAIKRRKGAVQEMREGAEDGTYDGEATGVRTHVRKSLKLA